MKKIRFKRKIYEVVDETEEYYICPPESIIEGWHWINKTLAKEIKPL